MPCTFEDARQLMMESSRVFAQIENNGMRMDVAYLDRMIGETADKIAEMEASIKQSDVWKLWSKTYGTSANLGSGEQLGHILFEKMGIPCEARTARGMPKTDQTSLERIDHPFIRKYLNIKKLTKARGTNLIGLRREQCNGFLRCSFNLHTAISYRGSASDPNTQNIPRREERIASLIRPAFIPRSDDHMLVEIDFKSAEIKICTCYHQDPTMWGYLLKGHDFHHELAMQCFKLTREQVSEPTRDTAKNAFVFAEFYGDYWGQVAPNMWNAIQKYKMQTADGTPLEEHLRNMGIRGLGTIENREPTPRSFMAHIKEIESDFWGNRFPVYAQWKKDFWAEYLTKGWFQTKTGFVCRGAYTKNKAINYPVQGSSFHCLLWCMIRIHDWLVAKKSKSCIIGQIHDSLLLDVHKNEFDDVIGKCLTTIRDDIRKVWDWIVLSLNADVGASEKNWHEKQKVKMAT